MAAIGWFSSAWDQQALRLLECAISDRTSLHFDIEYVLLTRSRSDSDVALKMAEAAAGAGIDVVEVPARQFRDEHSEDDWRDRFEEQVIKEVGPRGADFVVLAGYMWIARERLLGSQRMINLHPALPGGPTGMRDDILVDLIRSGASVTGAMMHVVSPELDRGAPLTFVQMPVVAEHLRNASEDQKLADLTQRLLAIEPGLVCETIGLLGQRDLTDWPPTDSDLPIRLQAAIS